ncbi:MAG: transcriptional repressor [Gammaproteobacteria bacterium]|nr:transcriptional repressor [Gammaproteobacteria bacterium]
MTWMTTKSRPPASPHDHQSCISDALAHAETVCQNRNKRLTDNRRAVLELLLDSHCALGAYEILRRFDWGGRAQAPVQVYRALEFLESMGLVHRVASSNAYVACYQLDERHGAVLFVCKACGVVMEREEIKLGSMMDKLAQQSGFTIHTRLLEAVGYCPNCAEGAENAAA